MELNEAVSARIKELCKDKSITMYQLCALSGVPHTTIININKGTSRNPGIGTVKKLCDAFDISLSEFFDSELFM